MITPLQFAGVTAGQTTMVIAVVTSLLVYLVLTWTGNFDWTLYLMFVGLVTLLSINAMGFNILGVIFGNPLIAIVLGILGWQAIQAYRESNTTIVEVAGDKIKKT